MPPLPVVSGMETRKALERAGWLFVRQKGSHMSLFNPDTNRQVTVPNHKDIDKGTLKSILKQANLSVDEFLIILER